MTKVSSVPFLALFGLGMATYFQVVSTYSKTSSIEKRLAILEQAVAMESGKAATNKAERATMALDTAPSHAFLNPNVRTAVAELEDSTFGNQTLDVEFITNSSPSLTSDWYVYVVRKSGEPFTNLLCRARADSITDTQVSGKRRRIISFFDSDGVPRTLTGRRNYSYVFAKAPLPTTAN